jgi:trimethylamine--corrinoid protein Co-methyltransferase
MIDETGIHVPSHQALKMLEGKKGVRIKNGTRVCVSPESVNELIGPFPKKIRKTGDKPTFNVSGYSLRCYDMRTGLIRTPTANDLVEFTKIGHCLGARGGAMVMPQDMPQKLAEIATYKLCMDVSDRIFGAGIFSDAQVYDFVQEFQIILGNRYVVGMHMISPMAFDPFLLEMALRYIPKKAALAVGNMPMQGATCPIMLGGAIAQSCAEVLGGAAILKILAPECDVSFAPFVYPFDMKFATIVYGGPDFLLANLAVAQIAEFYGTTAMAKAFNTMGKLPDDAQVGLTAANCAVMMLAGMKNFGWSGTCSIDEIASVEEMIIQYEIFSAAMHIAKGFEFDHENLGTEIVSECTSQNSYLTHESTIRNFKRQFFMSDIFSNETFGPWDRAGRPTVREKAKRKALSLLQSHSFKRDPAQQKELDALWKKAQECFS